MVLIYETFAKETYIKTKTSIEEKNVWSLKYDTEGAIPWCIRAKSLWFQISVLSHSVSFGRYQDGLCLNCEIKLNYKNTKFLLSLCFLF